MGKGSTPNLDEMILLPWHQERECYNSRASQYCSSLFENPRSQPASLGTFTTQGVALLEKPTQSSILCAVRDQDLIPFALYIAIVSVPYF